MLREAIVHRRATQSLAFGAVALAVLAAAVSAWGTACTTALSGDATTPTACERRIEPVSLSVAFVALGGGFLVARRSWRPLAALAVALGLGASVLVLATEAHRPALGPVVGGLLLLAAAATRLEARRVRPPPA